MLFIFGKKKFINAKFIIFLILICYNLSLLLYLKKIN